MEECKVYFKPIQEWSKIVIKTFCDRCGKELDEDTKRIIHYNSWVHYNGAQQKAVNYCVDLCEECWQAMIPKINAISEEFHQKSKFIELA